MKANIKALIRDYAPVAIGILVFYAILFAVGITCPIKFITGISCPGCGMSRACFSMLTLHFEAAFAFHPLCFPLPIVAVLLLIFRIRNMDKAFSVLLYASIAALLIVYLIRPLLTIMIFI